MLHNLFDRCVIVQGMWLLRFDAVENKLLKIFCVSLCM